MYQDCHSNNRDFSKLHFFTFSLSTCIHSRGCGMASRWPRSRCHPGLWPGGEGGSVGGGICSHSGHHPVWFLHSLWWSRMLLSLPLVSNLCRHTVCSCWSDFRGIFHLGFPVSASSVLWVPVSLPPFCFPCRLNSLCSLHYLLPFILCFILVLSPWISKSSIISCCTSCSFIPS